MAPDNLAPDDLAPDNLAPDNLAPDNLAPGQFGTNIIKTDNLAIYYLGAKLSAFIILVPNCSLYYLGAKLSGAKLSYNPSGVVNVWGGERLILH